MSLMEDGATKGCDVGDGGGRLDEGGICGYERDGKRQSGITIYLSPHSRRPQPSRWSTDCLVVVLIVRPSVTAMHPGITSTWHTPAPFTVHRQAAFVFLG